MLTKASASWVGEPALPALQAPRGGKPCEVKRDRTSATPGCVMWGKPGPHKAVVASPVNGVTVHCSGEGEFKALGGDLK